MCSIKELEETARKNGVGLVRQIWLEAGSPGSYFYWLLDRWAAWRNAGCPLIEADGVETEEAMLRMKHRPGAREAMALWAAHEILGAEITWQVPSSPACDSHFGLHPGGTAATRCSARTVA